MKTVNLIFISFLVSALLVLNVTPASAQKNSDHKMMHDGASPHTRMDKAEHADPKMHEMNKSGHGTHSKFHTANFTDGNPTLPGQDAFSAIQEIITILEADPDTDWSKVNISKLRTHLVDMNRLVMDTQVTRKNIEGGLELTVTGSARALQAIQTMLPAHAPMIDGLNDWSAQAKVTANGAILTVTAETAKEVAHIKGLGFYGLMASGSHHQTHHIGLVRGEKVHVQ